MTFARSHIVTLTKTFTGRFLVCPFSCLFFLQLWHIAGKEEKPSLTVPSQRSVLESGLLGQGPGVFPGRRRRTRGIPHSVNGLCEDGETGRKARPVAG